MPDLGFVKVILLHFSGVLHVLVLLHQVIQAVDCCNCIAAKQLPLLQTKVWRYTLQGTDSKRAGSFVCRASSTVL